MQNKNDILCKKVSFFNNSFLNLENISYNLEFDSFEVIKVSQSYDI